MNTFLKNELWKASGNNHYIERYISFIQSRSENFKIYERHHILPKSLWPCYSNLEQFPFNEIKLSPREHYISHWILAKAFGGKMIYAFNMMSVVSPNHDRTYKINSKAYEFLKLMMVENNPSKSDNAKHKISNKAKDRWKCPLFRNKMKIIRSSKSYKEKHSKGSKKSWESKDRRKSHGERMRKIAADEKYKKKMSIALKYVWSDDDYRKTMSEKNKQNWTDERRKEQSIRLSGENSHFYGRDCSGEKNPFFGKTHTDETRKKISESSKNRIVTDETRKKISEANTGKIRSDESKIKYSKARTGATHTEDAKNIISEKAKDRCKDPEYRKMVSDAQKNRKRGVCPHCSKEMDICNLKRHHLDNCKFRPINSKE